MKLSLIVLTAGLCALLAGVLLFSPTEVGALPSVESDIIYLDAAGYPVGESFRGCNNYRFSEGIQTEIKLINITACSTGSGSTNCYLNGSPAACDALPFRCIIYGGHTTCPYA